MKIQYIVIAVFIILFLLVLVYMLNLQNIKFKEDGTIKEPIDSNEQVVYILKSYEDSLAFPEDNLANLEFESYNYIVTKGWKLRKIQYSKFNVFSKVKERLVKITLYEKDKNNYMYIYKIDKIDIFLDEHYSNGGIILE